MILNTPVVNVNEDIRAPRSYTHSLILIESEVVRPALSSNTTDRYESSYPSLGRQTFFHLIPLSPDGGVSIRTSRMNIYYGNHGNETSREAVLSIQECH